MFNGTSITEVCFSFSPGCYSQVGSIDRVRGHRQGLVAGINRAQNPIFDRFPVAPLLLSPRHRKSHEIFSIEESSGPFLLLCLTSVFMQQRVHQQHRCRHVLCLVRRDLGSVCTDTGESRSWFWSAHFVIRRPHYCCPFHSSPKPVPLKPLYLNFSILLASPGNFTFLASERPLLFCFYFGFILESLILQSCLCKFF